MNAEAARLSARIYMLPVVLALTGWATVAIGWLALHRYASVRTDEPLTLAQLFDRNAAAMGGRARLDELTSVVTLRTSTSLTSLKLPHFVLVEGFDSAGSLNYAEGYDGRHAWEQTRRDSVRRLVSGRAEVALRRVVQWPGNVLPLYRMPEFGHAVELEGADTLDGVAYHRVRVTLSDGFDRWYFVNPATYRIERARDTRELHAHDGNVRRIETLFSDYREVDGYWFPFTVSERDIETGEQLSARTMLAIFPNAEVADSLFDPAGRSDFGRVESFRRLAAVAVDVVAEEAVAPHELLTAAVARDRFSGAVVTDRAGAVVPNAGRNFVALVAAMLAPGDSLHVERIAPSIYVAGQPDPLTYPVEGNVTIIVNEADIVVVDAGRTPRSARALIDAIRRISSKPVSVVVNTHWHGDHHHGNAEFRRAFPGVEIIAHAAAREEIETLGRSSLQGQIRTQSNREQLVEAIQSGRTPGGRVLTEADRYRLRRLVELSPSFLAELNEVVITPPTLTFERELVLHRGERRIVIIRNGPGNTSGDAIVHLPQEGIVITGDLLVATVPFMSVSFPAQWLERLREIRALSPRILVPGHGRVLHDSWYLDTHIELLEYVVGHVRRGLAEGLPLAEVERTADLSGFRHRYARSDSIVGLEFDFRVGQTVIASAYRELSSNGRDP